MADRGPGWTRLPAWLEARPRRILAAGFALGLGSALGQAPVGFAPATLIGLAGAYALLGAAPTLRRAGFTGWAFGLGYFGLTLIWIVQPFLVDLPRHGWMAPFGLFFMASGMALFWAAAFAVARWLTPSGRLGWLGFAVAMGAAEMARATLFTGFPWGGPGLSWIGTPLAQLGSLVGAFGLSVLTAAAAAGLWVVIARRQVMPVVALVLGLVASVGLSLALERADVPTPPEQVTLRLVQPNAPQHQKWDPDHLWTFFDRARALTMKPTAPGAPQPDLVIWPETAVPTILGRQPDVQAAAAASAAPAPLVAGIRRYDGRLYNSLALWAPDGAADYVYDKHHVVPFGEYVPLGNLLARFGIHGLATQEGRGYSSGPGAVVFELPGGIGKVLPLICYEAIFPRDLRTAPERADWILQITNDAWFGTFSGPQQHLAQARMRAIEFGLPFVRAANTGISAVIDARGRVLASLPLGEAGKLDAPLPGALPPTIYARWGDAPVVLALMLAFGALFATRRAKAVDRGKPGR